MTVADRIARDGRRPAVQVGAAGGDLRAAEFALGRRFRRRRDLIEGRVWSKAALLIDSAAGRCRCARRRAAQGRRYGLAGVAAGEARASARERAAPDDGNASPARVFEIGYRGDVSLYKVRLADRSLMKVAARQYRAAVSAVRDRRPGVALLAAGRRRGADAMKRACSTQRQSLGQRALVVLLPYLWLAAFFLVPFLIVLKISLSQTAIAQPPYMPVLDLAAGWQGLKDFVAALSLDNYRAARLRPRSICCSYLQEPADRRASRPRSCC